MTICVAAIAHRWGIVAATDKMYTAGDMTYEGTSGKQFFFLPQIAALGARDSSDELEICRRTLRRVQFEELTEVRLVAELFAEEYRRYRQEIFERELLSVYKLSLDSFNDNQRSYSSEFVSRIQSQLRDRYLPLSDREFGCSTIIAGVDETGGHIYVVRDPGQVSCEDGIGFVAVGSGARHAESYLMLDGYNREREFWHATLSVYAAKRQAERAPFVGPATELFRIGMSGWGRAKETELDEIEKIYQATVRTSRRAGERAKQQMTVVLGGLTARSNQAQIGEVKPEPGETSEPSEAGSPATA